MVSSRGRESAVQGNSGGGRDASSKGSTVARADKQVRSLRGVLTDSALFRV